jgi:hypothetical protein
MHIDQTALHSTWEWEIKMCISSHHALTLRARLAPAIMGLAAEFAALSC